jgi:hypothetical protein
METAYREDDHMRIVAWILGGIVLGLLAGVATGLLRRQPTRYERRTGELATAYAGGYAPPTPAVDRTATHRQATQPNARTEQSEPREAGGGSRGG